MQTPTAPTGSERILMVEDDERLLEVTSDLLTELGYRVACARHGAGALQMLKNGQEFELLFSDVVMASGMNGVELAREARQLDQNIKILLTSGYAEEVLQRHRAVGEFAVIGKPFRRAELAQRLRAILQEN